MDLMAKVGFKKAPPPKPSPPTPTLAALAPEPEWVGWRLATFAVDSLRPTPGIKTSSVAVWRAYLGWCREGKCVPLAMAVFQNRFDKLAEEVGIHRFQNGAHVFYRDVSLRKA